ncbi:MAG: type II toxin-antitoxin system RelE/ParE family toxin [Sulfurovum sp.]|nr:type II toxin-antitoxin system RelE/ParE family toxin [Sulfurovum sp.]
MKLVKDDLFTRQLSSVILYIAKDSKSRARQFRSELQRGLETLIDFPYRCRRSIYYEDEAIRDYIFKGYTIPYLVDKEYDVIVLLDIFKWIDKERK